MAAVSGGDAILERVILTHKHQREGPLSDFLGDSKIELIRVANRQPRKIFGNRYWGDLGFIHLCFDIRNMKALEKTCEEKGYPFTVDGGEGFAMGDASGHFCYIEDPDGTLIEFVETRKLPVMKKLNWYLDLHKRSNIKPLPKWMLRALRFSRKKIAES
jgi:catechol 2,3-dioxygenase-like lactoylglutathione lyase family enzyme